MDTRVPQRPWLQHDTNHLFSETFCIRHRETSRSFHLYAIRKAKIWPSIVSSASALTIKTIWKASPREGPDCPREPKIKPTLWFPHCPISILYWFEPAGMEKKMVTPQTSNRQWERNTPFLWNNVILSLSMVQSYMTIRITDSLLFGATQICGIQIWDS